ncbi:hypothetical protein [Streptomyces formicae]
MTTMTKQEKDTATQAALRGLCPVCGYRKPLRWVNGSGNEYCSQECASACTGVLDHMREECPCLGPPPNTMHDGRKLPMVFVTGPEEIPQLSMNDGNGPKGSDGWDGLSSREWSERLRTTISKHGNTSGGFGPCAPDDDENEPERLPDGFGIKPAGEDRLGREMRSEGGGEPFPTRVRKDPEAIAWFKANPRWYVGC